MGSDGCRILRAHSGSVYSLSFTPDDRYLLSASEDQTSAAALPSRILSYPTSLFLMFLISRQSTQQYLHCCYWCFVFFSPIMGCSREFQKHCNLSRSFVPCVECSSQVAIIPNDNNKYLLRCTVFQVVVVISNLVQLPVTSLPLQRIDARASGRSIALHLFEHLMLSNPLTSTLINTFCI